MNEIEINILLEDTSTSTTDFKVPEILQKGVY